MSKRRDGTSVLSSFRELARRDAIGYYCASIEYAGLNVNDSPWIADIMGPITQDLMTRLRNSDISYDAIVGIPSGGELWAERVLARDRRRKNRPSLYKLRKIGTAMFATIDGQDVGPGAKMVLVDDTIYLGNTSHSADRVLREAGYEVVAVVSPVAIGHTGCKRWKERGVPVLTTYNHHFLTKHAKEI